MSVLVRPLGNLGNNLYAYALGRILAEDLGLALTVSSLPTRVVGNGIESASGTTDFLAHHREAFGNLPFELPGATFETPSFLYTPWSDPGWDRHTIDLEAIRRQRDGCKIALCGFFQRAEYYEPDRDRIRQWFRLTPHQLDHSIGTQDVIVHIRRSVDYRLLGWQLDLDFYRQCLEACAPRRVYVCGLGIDERVHRALAPWHPLYVEAGALETLRFMTAFSKIICANSTFSWWGAFLSHAEAVHLPIPDEGAFSPTLGIDLRVDAPQFHYHASAPLEHWRPFRVSKEVRLAQIEPGHYQISQPGNGGTTLRLTSQDVIVNSVLNFVCSREDPFGATDLPRESEKDSSFRAFHVLGQLVEAGVLIETDTRDGDPPLKPLLLDRIDLSRG